MPEESGDAPLRSTQSEFVGRAREVAELCGGLEDARRGRGGFFLVTGEPGIGKTSLADEVARRAESSAMAVVRAGCWEGAGAPAYWPFIQVIRSALGGIKQDQGDLPKPLSGLQPALAHDLAQLVPALLPAKLVSAGASAQPSPDPDQARFRLFDSVATVVRDMAALRPLLLIVEDLHEADQPSLLMLRFVVRHLRDAPVLVLCTYRDVEVQHSPGLSRLVGYLTHEGIQVPLFALSRGETAQLIQERAGVPPNPRLVSDIYQATAGNPLFIDGLVRVLAAERSLGNVSRLNLGAFRVPDGVRQAIRRWLALLSDRSLLAVAATIGQQFELRCLRRVTQAAGHQLPDVLREAANLGIVVPLSGGAYRFAHALIRNTLCDELDSAQRARVHLQIGEALEEIYQPDVETHVAELAHHFLEGGDINKAIDYSIRAGEAARAVFAYEDAVAHWQTALELMPERAEDRERRADLLERMAELLGLAASEGDRQLKCLERALKLYRELGRPEGVARVRARMAISVVGEDVRIERGLDATHRAMEISEQLGDQVLWARAASSHAFNLCARGQLKQSFALIRRVSEEAERLNDNITGFGILAVPAEMLVWLCDPLAISSLLRRELAQSRRIAESPLIRGILLDWLCFFETLTGNLNEAGGFSSRTHGEPVTEAQVAFYRGEWEQAELALAQAFEQARGGGRSRRLCVYAVWLAKVRGALGRHSAADEILREHVSTGVKLPHLPLELHARQELALLYAQTQRPQQAHPHLERCREILAAGEDWRGLAGHVARAEAAVAAAEGRFEVANAQFATAVEIYRRYQVPFEEAEALHLWGRALLAAGDHGAALEKLDAATELYRRHGAGERWLQGVEADKLRARSTAVGGEPRTPAARASELGDQAAGASTVELTEDGAPGTAVFRKQEEYWTVSWAGHESRLKHRKGFDYLVRLLRHPGREFAAVDLIAGGQAEGQGSTTTSAGAAHQADATIARGLGDAGAALDATAKAQYRRRLEDLRDELELAEQHNDLGSAEQARAEIEFIQAEVAAAVGLRGRNRKSASHPERARLAVTKAIKVALSRIRAADPELGRHLSLSIQTGYFCAYRPKQPVTWGL